MARRGNNLALVAALLLSGCATPIDRLTPETSVADNGLYPATKEDVELLCGYWAKVNPGPRCMFDTRGDKWLTPITLVDLPIALALDTMFLPLDVPLLFKSRKSASASEVQPP